MTEEMMIGLLHDYGKLNAELSSLREDQLKALINYECSTKKRASFIERLHQRYSKLYVARERAELLGGGLL